MIELFPEQREAVQRIQDWWDEGGDEFKLGGYAGTGKTTIIMEIKQVFKSRGLKVGLGAFTGKAASVLRKKGNHEAQTLHSMIYEFDGEEFFKVDDLDFDLIICDEASMISRSLYEDLTSFGIPIIWVGDPGQLEPVGDDINLMLRPDYVLQTIHRQGEGSKILDFAAACRHNQEPRSFLSESGGEVILKPKSQLSELSVDQIICGFNKTRTSINRQARSQLGFTGKLLVEGEKIIILRNDRKLGVFNGLTLYVDKILSQTNRCTKINAHDDIDKRYCDLRLLSSSFGREQSMTLDDFRSVQRTTGFKDLVLADYAYCITGHKSQGSEWDSVAVIEEIWDEKWQPSRWRYTTATRAAKQLFYYFR